MFDHRGDERLEDLAWTLYSEAEKVLKDESLSKRERRHRVEIEAVWFLIKYRELVESSMRVYAGAGDTAVREVVLGYVDEILTAVGPCTTQDLYNEARKEAKGD